MECGTKDIVPGTAQCSAMQGDALTYKTAQTNATTYLGENDGQLTEPQPQHYASLMDRRCLRVVNVEVADELSCNLIQRQATFLCLQVPPATQPPPRRLRPGILGTRLGTGFLALAPHPVLSFILFVRWRIPG